MSEPITVYLAGPGASTAHRERDCSFLTRRSPAAADVAARQAVPHLPGSVTVTSPLGGVARAVKLCRSCGGPE